MLSLWLEEGKKKCRCEIRLRGPQFGSRFPGARMAFAVACVFCLVFVGFAQGQLSAIQVSLLL